MPALYFAQAFTEGMQAVLQSIHTGNGSKHLLVRYDGKCYYNKDDYKM